MELSRRALRQARAIRSFSATAANQMRRLIPPVKESDYPPIRGKLFNHSEEVVCLAPSEGEKLEDVK